MLNTSLSASLQQPGISCMAFCLPLVLAKLFGLYINYFAVFNLWAPIIEFCFLLRQGYVQIYRTRRFQ